MTSSAEEERTVFQLQFRVAGKDVRLELGVPNAVSTVADLLPLLQGLTDVFVEGGERGVERRGLEISCRAGCGACCRQLVPVGESEAIRLAELVEAMSPDRRAAVRERFAAALATFEERGLLARLRGVGELDAGARRAFGMEYFFCGVPCPFLEDESCSIHADRPLGCREYLVTSPATGCAEPDPARIDKVPLPLYISRLLYRFEDGRGDDRPRWLPLVLALERGEELRARPRLERRAPELMQRFLQKMTAAIEGPAEAPESPED